MTTNGQVDAAESILASIPNALPSDHTRGSAVLAQQAMADIHQVLTRLPGKKPLFRSTGVSRLRVTDGGEGQDLMLAITSVSFETNSRLLEEAYVEPPRSRKQNKETLEIEMVLDAHTAAYQSELAESNRRYIQRYALHALDCDLEDQSGQLIWARDGSVRHEDAAVGMLKFHGLTQYHFTQIREDAEALTMNQKQVAEALRQKKQL